MYKNKSVVSPASISKQFTYSDVSNEADNLSSEDYIIQRTQRVAMKDGAMLCRNFMNVTQNTLVLEKKLIPYEYNKQ